MSPLASFFALPFPNIDPVALQLGPVAVKWYGLAYMAGLLLGWLYIRRLVQNPALWPAGKPPFGLEKVDDLLFSMTLGVVLGGRLGFGQPRVHSATIRRSDSNRHAPSSKRIA